MSHNHPQSFHHEHDPVLRTREHTQLAAAASLRDLGRLISLLAEDLAAVDPERIADVRADLYPSLAAEGHPEVEAAIALDSALDLIDSAISTLETEKNVDPDPEPVDTAE